MEVVEKRLNDIETIIFAECGDAKRLKGNRLDNLLSRLHITWDADPIYYSKSKIIFTEVNDYERFIQLYRKAQVVLKLEMPNHNSYLYVMDYIECDDLDFILGTKE